MHVRSSLASVELAPPHTRRAAWRVSARAGRWATYAVIVIAVAAILLRHWQLMGSYPTGFDAGNWLALGRGLVGGPGNATGGTYPPLVPFLLQLARWLFGSMTAAKLVGIGSLAAVMAAAYVAASAAHAMHRLLAAAAALTVGLAGQVMEPVAFGGYPQNYAFAFLLVAGAALAGYLYAPSRSRLVVGSAALAGAALSHHIYYPLACLVIAGVWLVWLTSRPSRRGVLRTTLVLVAAWLPSVVIFLPTVVALGRAGYSAPVGASGLSVQGAFFHSIDEARWLWIPLISVGAVYIALTPGDRHRPAWMLAASLLVVSGAVFIAAGEQRLMPPLIAGAVLGCGLALDSLRRRSTNTKLSAVSVAAAAAYVLVLLPIADRNAADLYDYYRLADRSLLNATGWIARHPDPGLVVVRQDQREWPVGWWFEGLTNARIVTGSNPKFLGFPRERENNVLASRFFDSQQTANGLRALAAQTGVRYLVFYKSDWHGWQQLGSATDRPLAVAFDDGEFVIVDIAGG